MIESIGLTLLGAALAAIYQWQYVCLDVSVLRSLLKTLSVVALALASFFGLAPIEVTGALIACAFGDLFLSRRGWWAFGFGILAFAIGQIAYSYAFGLYLNGVSFPPRWFIFGIGFAATIGILVLPKALPLGVRIAMMGYGCFLVTMVWIALSSFVVLLAVGAVLFLISDLMIAGGYDERLPPKLRETLQKAVWATYWPAQAAILWGFSLTL
ncbi:MAG: lysoplasmalogenase [Pseudomonadota bacterium]